MADDAFAPVTIATDRDVLAQQGANLTDTLQNRPGIVGSTFAPGASRPIIRGLDSYRVRLQENGIGSHDVATISEDHAVPIDPFAADRIEVVRGPATLRYGSGAVGGVVAVENVPRIPPHRLGGGLYFRDSNWFARAGVLHALDQNRIGAETIATPGYTLVSAELSDTTRVGSAALSGQAPQLTIGVKGENLADDEVLSHASFERREEVLAPGASVRLFGAIKFD